MGKSDFKNKLIIVFLIVFIVVAGIITFKNRGRRRAVPNLPEPIQLEADGATAFEMDGYNVSVSYLYAYDITALVVSTHDYVPYNFGNKLSPRDFALAWGSVAATNETVDYNWSQSGRWYKWYVSSYEDIIPVGGEAGVNCQSANTHIIPATSLVKDEIERVKTGDCIHMKGYLVSIYATDSKGATFTWSSSTSREDTGDGACEVFYVTDIEWVP